MEKQSQEAHVLIEIKDVSWFRLLDNNRQLISTANLRICCLSDQNVYYLNHGEDLYLTLQQENSPVICAQFKTHKAFVVPHVDTGFCAFTLPLESTEIVQLEIVLSNIATLIPNRNALALQNPGLINSVSQHCVNIFDTPLVDDDEMIHMIKKGGSFLKEGFTWLGKVTASGVNKAGQYIDSKITSTNRVEISEDKKEKFNKIKDTAKTTLQVTGNVLESILTPIGKAISSQVDDINKKIDQGDNETLKKIKKVGGATLSATTVAFSGLQTGAIEVGKSLGNNTRHLVEKKYGDDITNTIAGRNSQSDQEYQQHQQQEQQEQQNSSNPFQQQDSQTHLLGGTPTQKYPTLI